MLPSHPRPFRAQQCLDGRDGRPACCDEGGGLLPVASSHIASGANINIRPSAPRRRRGGGGGGGGGGGRRRRRRGGGGGAQTRKKLKRPGRRRKKKTSGGGGGGGFCVPIRAPSCAGHMLERGTRRTARTSRPGTRTREAAGAGPFDWRGGPGEQLRRYGSGGQPVAGEGAHHRPRHPLRPPDGPRSSWERSSSAAQPAVRSPHHHHTWSAPPRTGRRRHHSPQPGWGGGGSSLARAPRPAGGASERAAAAGEQVCFRWPATIDQVLFPPSWRACVGVGPSSPLHLHPTERTALPRRLARR